jgi:hypothetical protein
MVSPTVPFRHNGLYFDEVGDDPLCRPLGDADLFGDVSQADVRVTGDAEQYLSVVREKPPVAAFVSTWHMQDPYPSFSLANPTVESPEMN